MDGYRARLHIRGGRSIVYSSRGHNWTKQFSRIAKGPEPLVIRKRKLAKLLRGGPPAFVLADHLEGEGDAIFEQGCRMGLEGIVAKKKDASYRSGRQESWVKIKCTKSDTFPIVAFVEKLASGLAGLPRSTSGSGWIAGCSTRGRCAAGSRRRKREKLMRSGRHHAQIPKQWPCSTSQVRFADGPR